jgi:hypothetical protein
MATASIVLSKEAPDSCGESTTLWGADPMGTEDFKRKTTAVFRADIAGYSRLMGCENFLTGEWGE